MESENQHILQMNESNIVKVSKADRENILFMTGVKTGVKDKADGINRDLEGYAEDFVRGYKIVPRDSWWNKANAKLTQWAADLGNSYGRR